MTRNPRNRHQITCVPGDRSDDADRKIMLQKHGSLLDVHLKIGAKGVAWSGQGGDGVGIEPGFLHDIAET